MNRSLSRCFTLVEIAAATALFSILLLLAGLSLQMSTDTLQLTSSMTMSTMEADRVMRVLRSELRSARSTGANGVAVVGNTVTYSVIDASTPLLNTADPFTALPTTARVIRFEPDGAEILGNGVDDDGDFLVDEGRIAIYNAPGLPADLLSVVGTNILGMQVAVTPAPLEGLAKIQIQVTVQRVILAGSNNPQVEFANNQGPRATHRANSHMTLLN